MQAIQSVGLWRPYLVWPPMLEKLEVLGYVCDVNGNDYPRDIGRSVSFGNKIYYIFGDTFCHNAKNEFVGLSCNTIAEVPDLKVPTACRYQRITDLGFVPEFIPFTAEEMRFNQEHRAENRRMALWSYSGIIEDTAGCGTGYIFYDKVGINGAVEEFGYGVGIARVTLNDAGEIRAERMEKDTMFGADEPRWGSISTLVHDGYVYLFGGYQKKIHLARITVEANDKGALLKRGNYEFLTVTGWRRGKPAVEYLLPILEGMAQGAVFVSDFAHESTNFVFVGVDHWMQSGIWMGVARNVEGPYEMFKVGKAVMVNKRSTFHYCIYPHLWCSEDGKGKMMITWTENNPSQVVAAKLTLKRQDGNGFCFCS